MPKSLRIETMRSVDIFEKAILKCQWVKKNTPLGYKNCGRCYHKFDCYAKKARKFEISLASCGWQTFEVFAESKEDALRLWQDYGDECGIIDIINDESETHHMETQEIHES